MRHPETELIPYLRGELHGEEEESVSRHLRECAICRGSLEEIRGALEALRAARPILPEPDWRRYRAELRRQLGARSAPRWSWRLPRLVPIAATAAVASIALVLVMRPSVPQSPAGEELPFQEVAIGSHLDMLRDYSVAENLDLLEDLDVVQDLDALSPSSGASSASSASSG
jgi:anti-sigma factor RsiW